MTIRQGVAALEPGNGTENGDPERLHRPGGHAAVRELIEKRVLVAKAGFV